MIYRVLFAALIGVSLVFASSDPAVDQVGESVDAPPQTVMVDEEQPAAAFQDDQPPTHVASGGANGSAPGGSVPNTIQEGVTGQPSVTEYKFSSDGHRNTTDSSLAASTLTAMAAISLTILL